LLAVDAVGIRRRKFRLRVKRSKVLMGKSFDRLYTVQGPPRFLEQVVKGRSLNAHMFSGVCNGNSAVEQKGLNRLTNVLHGLQIRNSDYAKALQLCSINGHYCLILSET